MEKKNPGQTSTSMFHPLPRREGKSQMVNQGLMLSEHCPVPSLDPILPFMMIQELILNSTVQETIVTITD